MRYRRRMPIGATVVLCALAVPNLAKASSVCERSEEVVSLSGEENCRESRWIGQILSEHKSHKDKHDKDKHDKDKHHKDKDEKHKKHDWNVAAHDSHDDGESSAPTGPRPAAVIPLPAPVWSGVSGLAVLVAASAVRKVRRIL